MLDNILSPDLIKSVLRTVGGSKGALVAEIIEKAREQRGQGAAASESGQKTFLRWLKALDGGVILIVGRRGQGKTALTCLLAEFLNRQTKVIGIKQHLLDRAGVTWEEIGPEAVDENLHDCLVLVDDSSLYFNAVDHMTDVSRHARMLMDITRQRNVLLIFNIQRTSVLDKQLYQDPDAILCKPPSKMFIDGERPAMRNLQIHADELFNRMDPSEWRKWVYVVSDVYTGMMPVPLPKMWIPEISVNKGYGV